MNKVAAFALRRKNSILSMSEKMFCPPQPLRFWITPACAGKRARPRRWVRPPRDHPRVCGEKPFSQLDSTVPPGSPPRVRGKAWGRCCPDRLRWDHPCICGENILTRASRRGKKGSPPRVRGKATLDALGRNLFRITPAHAGKSPFSGFGKSRGGDHPRACGEKGQDRHF